MNGARPRRARGSHLLPREGSEFGGKHPDLADSAALRGAAFEADLGRAGSTGGRLQTPRRSGTTTRMLEEIEESGLWARRPSSLLGSSAVGAPALIARTPRAYGDHRHRDASARHLRCTRSRAIRHSHETGERRDEPRHLGPRKPPPFTGRRWNRPRLSVEKSRAPARGGNGGARQGCQRLDLPTGASPNTRRRQGPIRRSESRRREHA